MGENYCFECGRYGRVDDMTKLCDRCYRLWLDRRGSRQDQQRGN